MNGGRRGFWEGRHRAQDNYWLTGSTLEELRRLYALQLAPGGAATEVGVGTGACTRGLVAAGYEVTAVDVATLALARVAAFATTLPIEDLPQASPADLALCHLVLQHVDDDMVRHILLHTPLKPEGVFAFQTAWMDRPAVGLAPDMHGLVWHSGDEVERMARSCRLDLWWRQDYRFEIKGDVVYWSCFKARRTT